MEYFSCFSLVIFCSNATEQATDFSNDPAKTQRSENKAVPVQLGNHLLILRKLLFVLIFFPFPAVSF